MHERPRVASACMSWSADLCDTYPHGLCWKQRSGAYSQPAVHVLEGASLAALKLETFPAGEKNLLDADIPAIAAKSPDGAFARQDLVDAIAGGNFPEWYLYIQTLDPADQDKYDFDPLDPTKVRPIRSCSTFHTLNSDAPTVYLV